MPTLRTISLENDLTLPMLLCACAKSLQSCLTLRDPMGCSAPGSSVHGILQAWILEWVAMPSSRGLSWPRGSNPHLLCLHWLVGSLPLVPPGKPTYTSVTKSNAWEILWNQDWDIFQFLSWFYVTYVFLNSCFKLCIFQLNNFSAGRRKTPKQVSKAKIILYSNHNLF